MTDIPENHPRYRSLVTRERIVQAMRNGIVAEAGLIAHGRGEALDYLMGERTLPEALRAEQVAAQVMLLAERSVISVNGNTVILAAEEIVELARLTDSRIEVNLFHRTPERIRKITEVLVNAGTGTEAGTGAEVETGTGAETGPESGDGRGPKRGVKEADLNILGAEADARIPGLESERGKCCADGIGSAEVILVPLEDGDRAEALKRMGKVVICIDLNPLSRTSRTSDIAIADEVGRALGNMIGYLKQDDRALMNNNELVGVKKETDPGTGGGGRRLA